jgi:hypothetical protein
MLRTGQIHKSGLVVLAPHLTEENHRELLAAAKHRSKRQIEMLVAEWFPRPDVPSRIRKVPAPAPGRRATSEAPAPGNAGEGAPPAINDTQGFVLTPPKPKPSKVVPLAPARFKVEFTADQKLHDKLEKAKALLGPRGSRDLAPLFDRALDLLVADLEKKKYGKTSRPRRAKSKKTGGQRSRHVPNQVKREVAERDEQQCTFVDEQGNRCQERWGLELHHEELFVAGGPHTARNISLRCRAHNRYAAELELGAEYIEDKIAAAQAQAADPGERDWSPPS